MVVDLTIDGEDDAVIGVGKGLGATVCSIVNIQVRPPAAPVPSLTDTHDTQPLVAQNCD